MHIGSQITEPKPFAAAMERVANLVLDLRALGHRIKYVDAGGGSAFPTRTGAKATFARKLARTRELSCVLSAD